MVRFHQCHARTTYDVECSVYRKTKLSWCELISYETPVARIKCENDELRGVDGDEITYTQIYRVQLAPNALNWSVTTNRQITRFLNEFISGSFNPINVYMLRNAVSANKDGIEYPVTVDAITTAHHTDGANYGRVKTKAYVLFETGW